MSLSLVSVTCTDSNTVEVVFSAAVTVEGVFAITPDDPSDTVAVQVLDAQVAGDTVTLTTSEHTDSKAYTLTVPETIYNGAGHGLVSDLEQPYTGVGTFPTLAFARGEDERQVFVTFSELMLDEDALDPEMYQVYPADDVLADPIAVVAVAQDGPISYELTLNPLADSTDYVVFAANVRDIALNRVQAPAVPSFDYDDFTVFEDVAMTPVSPTFSNPDGVEVLFTATGLPTGISLDPDTGELSGTPTDPAAYPVTVTLHYFGGSTSDTFTLTVSAGAAPPSLTLEDEVSRTRPWVGVGVQAGNKSRVWLCEQQDGSLKTNKVFNVPGATFPGFPDVTMMCNNPGWSRTGSADSFGPMCCIEADDMSTVFAGSPLVGNAGGNARAVTLFGVSDGVSDGSINTVGGFTSSVDLGYTTPRQHGGGGLVGGAYMITGASGFSYLIKKDASGEILQFTGAISYGIAAAQLAPFVDVAVQLYDSSGDKIYTELIDISGALTHTLSLDLIGFSGRACDVEAVDATTAQTYVGGLSGELRSYTFTTTPGTAALAWSIVLSGSSLDPITAVRIVPGTNYLLVGQEHRLYLIDKTDGSEVISFINMTGSDPRIIDIALNDDDEYIYVCGTNDSVNAGTLWKIKADNVF